MDDALRRRAGLAYRRLDIAGAAAIGALCAWELASHPPHGAGLTLAEATATAVGCGAIAIRRRYPLALAVLGGAVFVMPGILLGPAWWNTLPDMLLLALVILSYTVGAEVEGPAALLGLAAIAMATSGGDLPGDVVSDFVFTVPAWVAGRVMRSRTRLTVQLAARAEQLEQEREAFAREAIRYERARIARDLHDVVAHNLSMIVVQAGAGRRALASDPATAAQSLMHIEGGAQQAEHEIEQLAGLLSENEERAREGGLDALDGLVRTAATTGLQVSYRHAGTHSDVPESVAQAAYHVTQEAITNALKHAPGAPITIDVDANPRSLTITIENGPPHGPRSGLEGAGGSHGIAGLRERLGPLDGSITAGPTAGGGWRLAARLPPGRKPTTS